MGDSSLIGFTDDAEERNVAHYQGEGGERECDWQEGAWLSYSDVHVGADLLSLFIRAPVLWRSVIFRNCSGAPGDG